MWGRAYTKKQRARDVRRAEQRAPAQAQGAVTMHAGATDQASG